MSSCPSLSKSSTITPPADENESTPALAATSTNRPTSSGDANSVVGISVARATRAPDSRRWPCSAMFSSHFASISSARRPRSLHEVIDGLVEVLGLLQRRTAADRQQTAIARRMEDIVVHLRPCADARRRGSESDRARRPAGRPRRCVWRPRTARWPAPSRRRTRAPARARRALPSRRARRTRLGSARARARDASTTPP